MLHENQRHQNVNVKMLVVKSVYKAAKRDVHFLFSRICS